MMVRRPSPTMALIVSASRMHGSGSCERGRDAAEWETEAQPLLHGCSGVREAGSGRGWAVLDAIRLRTPVRDAGRLRAPDRYVIVIGRADRSSRRVDPRRGS